MNQLISSSGLVYETQKFGNLTRRDLIKFAKSANMTREEFLSNSHGMTREEFLSNSSEVLHGLIRLFKLSKLQPEDFLQQYHASHVTRNDLLDLTRATRADNMSQGNQSSSIPQSKIKPQQNITWSYLWSLSPILALYVLLTQDVQDMIQTRSNPNSSQAPRPPHPERFHSNQSHEETHWQPSKRRRLSRKEVMSSFQ